MDLKKWFLVSIVIMGLFAGAYASLWYLNNKVDTDLKSAITTIGKGVTGRNVLIGKSELSLFTGKGSISEVKIPKAGKEGKENTIALNDIVFEIDPISLWFGPIRIKSLNIRNTAFDISVSSQLMEMADLVRIATYYTTSGENEYSDTRIILDRFEMAGGPLQISFAYKGRGFSRTVSIPAVKLGAIGASEGGVIPAEIARSVLKQIGSRISAITARAR